MRTIWALRGGRLTATPFSLRTQLTNTLDQARHANWPAKHVPNLPAWQKTCAAQPFHCAVVCMGRRRRASFELPAWRRPVPGQPGIPDGLQPFGLAKQPPVGPWALPAGCRRRPLRPRSLSKGRGTCHGCLRKQPGREVAPLANPVARRRKAQRCHIPWLHKCSHTGHMHHNTCPKQRRKARTGGACELLLLWFAKGTHEALITCNCSLRGGGGRLAPQTLNGTRCATAFVHKHTGRILFRRAPGNCCTHTTSAHFATHVDDHSACRELPKTTATAP